MYIISNYTVPPQYAYTQQKEPERPTEHDENETMMSRQGYQREEQVWCGGGRCVYSLSPILAEKERLRKAHENNMEMST